MDKNYFIFVANDIFLLDRKVSVIDIKDELLKNGFWGFGETVPLKNKLRIEDEVLIYLAGDKRREFVAAATIQTGIQPILKGSKEDEVFSKLGIAFLKEKVALKNVRMFERKVKIIHLLEKLQFVRDKKNYGLHLRLSIVRICHEDFNLILSQSMLTGTLLNADLKAVRAIIRN